MDPEPLRKPTGARRGVAGAVAAFAAAGLVIVWLASADERPAARIEAASPAPLVEEPRAALAPAAVASAADAEVRAEAPGEMQMCGGTWVRLNDDGDVDRDSVAAATKESVEALSAAAIAAMASSADEQARGAALAIAMSPPGSAKAPACEGDVACERESATAAKERVERRDALARLAQASANPTIYGWAVQACGAAIADGPGQCQVINAPQWARLDPANAAPWMAVAAKARAEKDSAGLDDALFRISVAERYDPGEYRLGAAVLDHVPDREANLWGTLSLIARGLGFDAAAKGDALMLASLCEARELTQDEVRRDACERSAEMLAKGSTTLNGLKLGGVIGKQVGWPQERIDRVQQESRELESAGTREHPTGAEAFGCRSLRLRLDAVREFAAHGEVAALRRRAAEGSSRTVASTSARAFMPGAVPSR